MNTENNPQTFLEVPGLRSSIMKIPRDPVVPLSEFHDQLVDSGLEILRLQIKTTTTEVEGKPGKFGFVLQHGGNGSSYQDDTIDFFGLVVLPLTTIYIVPQSSMTGRVKAYVYPENPDSAGLLERYRENWDLL